MKVSLEISMYPLAEHYVAAIESFISDLARREDLRVETNAMSTQVFGELDEVMSALGAGLKAAWREQGKAVFVMKIINSDLAPT